MDQLAASPTVQRATSTSSAPPRWGFSPKSLPRKLIETDATAKARPDLLRQVDTVAASGVVLVVPVEVPGRCNR